MEKFGQSYNTYRDHKTIVTINTQSDMRGHTLHTVLMIEHRESPVGYNKWSAPVTTTKFYPGELFEEIVSAWIRQD